MLKKILLLALIGVLGITLFASAATLAQRLNGYILLQVQANGEAWYVNPTDSMRYYMKDGAVAYQMMRNFGLGITDADLAKIPSVSSTSAMQTSSSICLNNATANRLKGRIMLQVQQNGEAWYIYPKTCRSIYMKDGQAAYEIMRFLGLGITNNDLALIPVNENFEANPTTSTPGTTAAIKFEGKYIDAHVHLATNEFSLEEVIKNMDSEGIDIAVIMEVPMGIYYGEPQANSGIPDAAQRYPNRFVALYGGEAITLLDSVVTKGTYTQAEEEKYTNLLEDAMKSGNYRGFGEIALRHSALINEKQGVGSVVVPGDHPWMFIMSDIAAEYDVPIDIHMDVETTNQGIAGLEKLLDHNIKTKIIWSHTAWSRNDYDTSVSVETMRQLLDKHPNLYSSLKIQPKETAFLDENNKIKPEWLELFNDYPDRFIIGSDIKPGQFDNEFQYVIRHRKFLEQLPSEILKPIERANAIKLFKIN